MKNYFRLLGIFMIATVLAFTGCFNDDGTGGGGDSVINSAAIAGVTAPSYGATPVTSVTETDQYTGTVSWSPSDDPFDFSKEYTATITLTAKSGYTLTGVEADFFTVAEAMSDTNPEDSGVITAEFPATEAPIHITYDVGTGYTSGAVPVDGTDYSSGATVTVLGDTGNLKGKVIITGINKAFYGWDTSSSATEPQYKAGSTFTITSDTTLYAIYTALRVTGPAGGLIFYDKGSFSNGWQYLEAWTADESGFYLWKEDETETGETSTEIGTGYNNTYNCMTGTEHPAAEVVSNATHGGKNDWFLPSRDELNQMCWVLHSRKYDTVDNPAYGTNRVGDFADESYWSSSENNDYFAWSQKFSHAAQYQFGDKDSRYNRVRAVRAF